MSLRSLSLLQAVSLSDQEAVKAFLAQGADVNARNNSGQTPLILAIVSGQDKFLRLLLDAGADPFLRDHTELNAVDWAERKGRSDLAHLLRTTQRRDLSNMSLNDKLSRREDESPLFLDQQRNGPTLSSDEKSRKWLSGIKRRFEESAESKTTKDMSADSQTNPSNIMRLGSTEPVVANGVPAELNSGGVTPGPEISQAPPTIDKATRQINKTRLTSDQVAHEIAKAPLFTNDAAPETASQTVAELSLTPQVEGQPASRRSSSRKRCPQCNTVYNSELLAYCAYHVVPLVDADEPIITPGSKSSAAMLWTLVLITLSLAAVVGLFLSGYLYKNNRRPSSSASPLTTAQQGIPSLGNSLVGKSVNLPLAEITVRTRQETASITVQIKIDRRGRVIEASSTEGNQLLREASIEAAKRSTFSIQKLQGRGAEGTITYTFK